MSEQAVQVIRGAMKQMQTYGRAQGAGHIRQRTCLLTSLKEQDDWKLVMDEIFIALPAVIREQFPRRGYGCKGLPPDHYGWIIRFNDNRWTTDEDVQAVCEKAIALLEEGAEGTL